MKKKLSKGGRSGSSNSISRESFSTTTIVMLLGSHALSFLCGSLYGSKDIFLGTLPPDQQMPVITTTSSCPSCPECPPCTPATDTRQEQEIANREALFPDTVKKYAVGMTYTSKNEFVEKFDSGVPWDEPTAKGDKDVLFIYANEKAMPNKKQESNSQALEYFSVDEATENCNFMHVLLNHRGGEKQQCLAIVPQYESFHLQKWMRVPSKGEGNPSLPLRLVSRGHQWNGISNFDPPVLERQTQRFWRLLRTFLDSFEGMKEELKPIVKKIAVKNTIIVMTCNLGQSELLLNFVCSAKSRGLDIGNILVFATDPETKELAESIGLTAYYNDDNFGHMPTDAASEYGDNKFVLMMMAKVICVQLISALGYDLLFQDVDIIWFKNPLDYFHDKDSPIANFDCYFQDDGARSLRYSPYSANSGFYYIRNNQRTKHFLTSVLLAGDLIMKTFSQQQALIAVLSEHASLYGLKVKVLRREDDGFPGGFHYHNRNKNYFYDFFQGKKDPYLLHMSWTTNKDNKLFFLRQMGEWYVQEQCIGKKQSEISLVEGESDTNILVKTCCSVEALFSCHYRDKPSKKPCRDSPPIDKGKPSFWNDESWAAVQKSLEDASKGA